MKRIFFERGDARAVVEIKLQRDRMKVRYTQDRNNPEIKPAEALIILDGREKEKRC